MTIMTSSQLRGAITTIRTNSTKLRETIHEALVSATYYAYKDGNAETYNQILEAVGNGTHKRGITLWVELVAGIAHVKEGKFALNKKVRNEAGIINEETFAAIEEEIRKVAWHEVAGEQKAKSVFDADKYLDGVIRKLERESSSELAELVKTALIQFHIRQNNLFGEVEHIELKAA
jgi:hypothetical protein